MKVIGIVSIIIWLIAGAATLMSDDKNVLRINYVIMWIVRIFQLAINYLVNSVS